MQALIEAPESTKNLTGDPCTDPMMVGRVVPLSLVHADTMASGARLQTAKKCWIRLMIVFFPYSFFFRLLAVFSAETAANWSPPSAFGGWDHRHCAAVGYCAS